MKRSKEPDNAGKNLLILTGFSCNNNCIVCSVRTKGEHYSDRNFVDLLEELEKGRKDGFRCVEFTGGEATIRGDIVELVSRAKQLGYDTIALSTNGRMLSYMPFTKKVIDAGLNKVTFSLLGPTDKIHNAIARTPGSFAQILKGIKNVQKFKDVHVNVSTVISKLNIKNIEAFGVFILQIGVRNWYLLDLIPDGNAAINYRALVVPVEDLYMELNSLSGIAGNFEQLGFFDFPICIFSDQFRQRENVRFINAKIRLDTAKQVGYNPKRITVGRDGVHNDVHRMNIPICRTCLYHRECGGVWKNYLEIAGKNDIESFARKNKCINNAK